MSRRLRLVRTAALLVSLISGIGVLSRTLENYETLMTPNGLTAVYWASSIVALALIVKGKKVGA